MDKLLLILLVLVVIVVLALSGAMEDQEVPKALGKRTAAVPPVSTEIVRGLEPLELGEHTAAGSEETGLEASLTAGAPSSLRERGAALTELEIQALQESFRALHQHSSEEDLLEAYGQTMGLIPRAEITRVHVQHLENGDFEELDVTDMGEGMTYVNMSQPGTRPVLTLIHGEPGRARRTTITPGELPAFERDIHYVNWLYDEMRVKSGQ